MTAARATDELSDPRPDWALQAGFANRFEAENEGCTPRNFSEFRDGKRLPAAALGSAAERAKRQRASAAAVDAARKKQEPELQPMAQILDASALLTTKLEPVRYAIPGWITEGVTLLVANPKAGKSTLVLQAVLALVTGADFWGEAVPAGKALVIDLETNPRRLRRKLHEAGIAELPTGVLLYATAWPRGIFGIEAIAQAVDADQAIRFVVIDTWQRFRDNKPGLNAYQADYEAMAPLQQLCKERPGLAIVVVHHRRKADAADPIDSINGSAAMAGAVDAIWVLGRKGADYVLHVQGRDWERDEAEFLLTRAQGRWELSDAPRFSFSERQMLSALDKVGPAPTAALAEALDITRQAALKRLQRMQGAGLVAFREGAWYALS